VLLSAAPERESLPLIENLWRPRGRVQRGLASLDSAGWSSLSVGKAIFSNCNIHWSRSWLGRTSGIRTVLQCEGPAGVFQFLGNATTKKHPSKKYFFLLHIRHFRFHELYDMGLEVSFLYVWNPPQHTVLLWALANGKWCRHHRNQERRRFRISSCVYVECETSSQRMRKSIRHGGFPLAPSLLPENDDVWDTRYRFHLPFFLFGSHSVSVRIVKKINKMKVRRLGREDFPFFVMSFDSERRLEYILDRSSMAVGRIYSERRKKRETNKVSFKKMTNVKRKSTFLVEFFRQLIQARRVIF